MNLNKVKFLVVDDDPDARRTVVDFLTTNGCTEVSQCKDGKEALKIIKNGGIEFLICDWEMPAMDGLELVKELRAFPQYKNLPILIITNPIGNEKLKVINAAENGVDAYLIKPFRARTLLQKIKQVIYEHEEELKRTVILVDDDDDVRAFLSEALSELGYNPVSGFNNANDAYQFLEKHFHNVALVISDWEMPKMTGIEFLQKVRMNRILAHVPFIIITSQTSVEELKVKKAIEADVDSYLMKPFRVDALQTKIKLVLAKAKLEVAIARGLENAVSAIADHDFEDAEREYRHVLARDAKNVDAMLGVAAIEMREGTVKAITKAIVQIEEAIKINPRYARAHVELALAYEASRSIDRSINTLQEALKQCFPLDRIHFHLGRLLIFRGKKEEGIDHLKKAIELRPKFEEARALLLATEEGLKKKE